MTQKFKLANERITLLTAEREQKMKRQEKMEAYFLAFVSISRNRNMKPLNVHTILVGVIIAAATLIPAIEACSNDTVARVGAGGIEFLKSEDIRMLEEILQISRRQVKIKYRFRNESDQDIHTTVAFPLPFYDVCPSDDPDARQIMRFFKVHVAGRSVPTETSVKAMVGHSDVTAQLRGVGLSDEQISGNADLTEDQRDALEALDGGKGEFRCWQVAATIFWRQRFPVGKEVVVEHQYKPLVGFTFGSVYYQGLYIAQMLPLCLDEKKGRILGNRLIKDHAKIVDQNPYIVRYDLEYILGTGRNWKGPIGEFKLSIQKDADEIISYCFPCNLKKISSTEYEFHQKDFVPPDNLIVYFYRVGQLDPGRELGSIRKIEVRPKH